MNPELIGAAVSTLADCCAAVSGNIHTLHLNFTGAEFDTFHKKVLKQYYEQLDDDYDELAEWSRCYGYIAPNKNESAERVEFRSFNGIVSRQSTVQIVDENLTTLLDKFKDLFVVIEAIKDCVISIGLANYLQDRIQYWAKEIYYFNKNRVEGGL